MENKKKKDEQLKPYFKILREAGKYLQALDTEKKKKLLEYAKTFYHKFLPLLSLDDSSTLFESLRHFQRIKSLVGSLSFSHQDKFLLPKYREVIVPMDEKTNRYIVAEFLQKEEIKGEDAVVLSLLFNFIKDFFKLNGEISLSPWTDLYPWEEILLKLETPFVFLGTDGTLLIHHQDFSRLGITPRECLQLNDENKIEHHGQVYSVFSNKMNDRVLVTFKTDKMKMGSNISSKELGVVSSSIAHELNNPLAGMLAAISLLGLEDLTEEERKALQDMKTSIERCKGLVDIFLGFSRMSPHLDLHGSLSYAFSQAMNLLRFRMVESNVRLTVKSESLDSFEAKFNPSIMAMFLYIVLNGILTLSQKNDLLMDSFSSKGLNLFAIVRATKEKMIFELESEIDFSSLLKSRLLIHLAELLGMKFDLSPGTILFSHMNR